MKTFKTNWLQKSITLILSFFILVAIFADFVANERPIFYNDGQAIHWPVFDQEMTGIDLDSLEGTAVYPPIPFSPTRTNLSSRFQPPLSVDTINGRRLRHWLGTDRLGRDVAAGMVHGCRKSIWVGLLAMLLAALFGVFIGCCAGWFGNRQLKIPWLILVLIIVGSAYITYLMYYHLISLTAGLFLLLLVIGLIIFTSSINANTFLPVDAMMMRSVEVLRALPTLLLLMVLSTLLSRPSLTFLAVIIALLRWPRFALFVRSEVQKIKVRNHILAAQISGLSDSTILYRLVLPEAMTSVVVIFAFGVASTIILESTLSFLGIGVPLDEVTWGSILGQARENISAWWLAIFPGFAIFIVIMSLNVIGEHLRVRLHPQN